MQTEQNALADRATRRAAQAARARRARDDRVAGAARAASADPREAADHAAAATSASPANTRRSPRNLRRLPLEHAERLADIDTRRAAIERAEVQIRARRNFDVRAPVSGRIVTVNRKVGDSGVAGGVRADADPGRFGAGRPAADSDQRDRLRRAGSGSAHAIRRVSVSTLRRSARALREVARSVLFDGDGYGPLRVTTAGLPRHHRPGRARRSRADERDVPLQSGMLFSADIVLERRSILEWVFEPLLAHARARLMRASAAGDAAIRSVRVRLDLPRDARRISTAAVRTRTRCGGASARRCAAGHCAP